MKGKFNSKRSHKTLITTRKTKLKKLERRKEENAKQNEKQK